MTKELQKKMFLKLLIVTAIFSLLALAFAPRAFAASLTLGCAIMTLNFYSLFHLMKGIFEGEVKKASMYTAFLMAKFALLGVSIFVLNRVFSLDLMGFGLGFFLVAISAAYVTPSVQKQ
jgi:hypothetical protein